MRIADSWLGQVRTMKGTRARQDVQHMQNWKHAHEQSTSNTAAAAAPSLWSILISSQRRVSGSSYRRTGRYIPESLPPSSMPSASNPSDCRGFSLSTSFDAR